MPTPIIWIFGQSNADGTLDVANITNATVKADHLLPYPAVQLVEKRMDAPVDPLVWTLDRGPVDLQARLSLDGPCGCELSLGRKLHRMGLVHNIVKTSIRGTRLSTHWLPTAVYPAGTNLWNQSKAIAHAAEAALGGTIAVGLWIQGEGDADADQATASAYEANLNALIDAFFAEWPNAYFVISRVHVNAGGAFRSTVRACQMNVAKNRPRVRIVSTDDISIIGEHWNSDGNVALGNRYADAISALYRPDRTVGTRFGARLGFK